MILRTDLALEAHELCPDTIGVEKEIIRQEDVTVSRISVISDEGARAIGKPRGSYITIELPALTDHSFFPDERYESVTRELTRILPREGMVLVIGLGNTSITPDALGPRTAAQVIATRHIISELRRTAQIDFLRPTAVLAPGVLGQTGIEALELLRALCKATNPAAVIVIDAMASRRLGRLGCTVQISDGGISPGAGVGNNRPQINGEILGVPVISIGVPTVVEAQTLAHDLLGGGDDIPPPDARGMIVTPREIDLLIDRASRLLALSINSALHPDIDPAELMSLV